MTSNTRSLLSWTDRPFIIPFVGACLVAFLQLFASAQEDPSQENDAVVAATVNSVPIFVSEVERQVAKVVRDRNIRPDTKNLLQAQALEQLIRRQLILMYLADKGQAASDQDIALAIEQARNRLAKQEQSLEDYLKRSNLTPDQFRRVLLWQLTWQRYLNRYLTDANLKRFFDDHRKQFDGTQIRAAHILLKVDSNAESTDWDATIAKATALLEQIRAGKLEFAEAAQQHSAAPSGKNGGDAGLISRTGPMSESFSRAAFELDKDQISEPVTSPFGVHLIRCLEIQPGQRRWQDVRPALEVAVTKFLFDWVAQQQRAAAAIEFIGDSPHFESDTQRIAN